MLPRAATHRGGGGGMPAPLAARPRTSVSQRVENSDRNTASRRERAEANRSQAAEVAACPSVRPAGPALLDQVAAENPAAAVRMSVGRRDARSIARVPRILRVQRTRKPQRHVTGACADDRLARRERYPHAAEAAENP